MNQNTVQTTSYIKERIAQLGINQDQYTKYVRQALKYNENK